MYRKFSHLLSLGFHFVINTIFDQWKQIIFINKNLTSPFPTQIIKQKLFIDIFDFMSLVECKGNKT